MDECAKYYLKLGTGVEEFSEFSLRVGECKGFQYHGFYSVLLTTIRNLGPQIAESLFLRSSKNGGHRNISVVFVVSARTIGEERSVPLMRPNCVDTICEQCLRMKHQFAD